MAGNAGSFKKGDPRAGRKPGVPNKTTAEVRQAFQFFVESNLDRVQELWNEVAAEDPARALDILDKLAGYCVPRLKSIEHTGDVERMVTVVVNRPPKDDPNGKAG